jgi:predicted Zn-dependent protease
MRLLSRLVLFLLLITAFQFISCHKNAVTGRSGLNIVPNDELLAMSYTEYNKFLSENRPLPESDSRVIMVRRMGSRIQKAVEKYYADKGLSDYLKGFAWEFNVVDQKEVNAWCMPGGKVVVYTGIIPVAGDESSLAVVMGHEIAHAIAQHGNERMSQGLLVQLGGAALSIALANKPQFTHDLFLQSYGIGSQLGMLKYSRSHESEADKMGVIFAAMAGYDPRAAISFWGRMKEASKGQEPPEIVSTHPSNDRRINDLKGFMKDAVPLYEASSKQG